MYAAITYNDSRVFAIPRVGTYSLNRVFRNWDKVVQIDNGANAGHDDAGICGPRIFLYVASSPGFVVGYGAPTVRLLTRDR